MARLSDARLKEARDYAIYEPSFTAAFMAWEKGWHPSAAHQAVKELLRLGIIKEIEPKSGPFAAVYQYDDSPRTEARHVPAQVPQYIGEPVADLAPPDRGLPVAHVSVKKPKARRRGHKFQARK